MELEILIQDLEGIKSNVQKLKNKYQKQLSINNSLVIEINALKVEADRLNKENIKIKEAQNEIEQVRDNAVLPSKTNILDESTTEKILEDKNQLKTTLNSFIEEIDQCIQIIKAKE